ncbi:hypothetical protein KKD52_18975 [Myxococcota bacterium]|nr:hypothetical protein [Myxococcota bacterium]
MMKSPSLFVFFATLFLTGATAGNAHAMERLRLTPGTLFIGGSIGISSMSSRATDAVGGASLTTVEFNPVVGVFVSRSVALTASLLWSVVDDNEASETTLAFAAGVRALGSMGELHGYIGAELLYNRFDGGIQVWQAGIQISGGILIPLHSRLALDTGVRLTVLGGDLDTGEVKSGYSTATITLGYFGIMGTFEL